MNSLWSLGTSSTVRGAARCFMLSAVGLQTCRLSGLQGICHRHIRPDIGLNLVEFMFSLSRFFSASHRSDLGVA